MSTIMFKLTIIILLLFRSALTDVSYYEILGVSREASTQEIKHAYKKLAVKLHPDKNSNKDQQKRFLEITEAYETLKDPQKRHKYDLYGSQQSYTRRYDYQSQTEYNNLYYNGLYHQDEFVETLSSRGFYTYLDEGLYFINFYSPFCPPCQNFAKHWKELAKIYKGIINVAAVNCKYYNSFCYNNMRIGSYPTLLFYPNGKNGSYLQYSGAHTFDALDKFVLKFVRSKVRVARIAQVVNSDDAMLYVLNESSLGENTILRIAYHLDGLVSVFMADHIQPRISKNPETTIIFKQNKKYKEIQSTDEREIVKEVVQMLPPVENIDFQKLQKIRNQLRNGDETPWVLYFTTQDDEKLVFYQMRVSLPGMNFGVIECDGAQEDLCHSLQTESTPAWAVLKAGGAFQRLRDVTRPPLRRAARARNLHSLSPADLKRALAGDTGIWVLLIAPYQVPWDHLEEPFTQASIEMIESLISFGIMSCTASTDKYCRSLTRNEPMILVQNGTNSFTYTGDANKDDITDFIQLLKETADIELSEKQASAIEQGVHTNAWVVAFLPKRCARACDPLRRDWRLVSQRLRPLDFVKVGMVDCDKVQLALCDILRTPISKFYPTEAGYQPHTISLQHLTETTYILVSVLDQIYDKVVKLNWQAFTKNVVAEELYPSRDKKPWLVYFHSPRCYHCYEMYPNFIIAAYHLRNSIQFGKVNCITERNICQHEMITHYPMIKLYLNRDQHHSQSAVVIFQPKHYTRLIEDIRPHLKRYNLLDDIKNIEIKSHVNFKDEL